MLKTSNRRNSFDQVISGSGGVTEGNAAAGSIRLFIRKHAA
jgi:hypothetical protein